MLLAIIDIDGTVADIRHRLAIAGKEPSRKNRKAFQQWLDQVQNDESLAADLPVPGMIQLLHAIEGNMLIVYLTGRAEKYRRVTEAWLDKHGAPAGELIMRKDEDWRTAAEYKEEEISNLVEIHQPYAVIAIDDDGSGDCAAMYQRRGITHLKAMNKWDLIGGNRG